MASTIRVGFSTTNERISRLIRWWTQSEVSHTFIVYYDETLDAEMVLDVAWSGYRVVPWSTFECDNQIVALIEPPVDMLPGLRAVARWLGRPYDWKAFARFSRWARVFVRHPVSNYKSLICTEVVIHALRISGYPGAEELEPKDTSPQQLFDFLSR